MKRMILAVLLTLANSTPAGTVRCTTYEEKTLGRLRTVCDDGTRGVSTYNRTLDCWETAIQSPRPDCRGLLNPRTQQLEVRCQ